MGASARLEAPPIRRAENPQMTEDVESVKRDTLLRIDQPLLPAKAQPTRMVFVAGGDYRLSSWSRPTDRRVRLTDYFIDKYEVSNREYKEFISAGGYLKRDLWKPSFVKDGRSVSWDDAMKVLVDRTGLPGPRSWSNQSFPDGTDVTWYERFRRRNNAEAQTWEERPGSLGYRTRLHGNELWLRSGPR